MSKTSLLIQRAIHPVGQGGFVTEFICPVPPSTESQNLYKVIYDCGSSTSRDTPLVREMKRVFKEDDVIDLLFISHFDADHINGLQKLKGKNITVRKLVIPLLSYAQKIFAYLGTNEVVNFFNTDELRAYFNAEQIIFFDKISAQSQSSNQNNATTLPSGTPIYIKDIPEWIYIPFNVSDDSRYIEFEERISENPTLYKKYKDLKADGSLKSNGKYFSKDEWKMLKDIYKDIDGKTRNNDSLVVYSGPGEKVGTDFKTKLLKSSYYSNKYAPKMKILPGALYTGDINFNQSVKGTSVLDWIAMKLSAWIDNIGLVQIPHHGSRHNFDIRVIAKISKATGYFYCYGTSNTYGHPDMSISIQLLANRKNCFEVTEDPQTEITQLISNFKNQ